MDNGKGTVNVLYKRNSFNKYGEVAHNDIAIVAAANTCLNEYREMSRKHNYAANFASQNSTHNTSTYTLMWLYLRRQFP